MERALKHHPKYRHLLRVRLEEDRSGNLHVWFLKPNLTHEKVSVTWGKFFWDTADLFAQFDSDKEAILDNFIQLTREGSRRSALDSLARGWPVHGWLPDDYTDLIEDNPHKEDYDFRKHTPRLAVWWLK